MTAARLYEECDLAGIKTQESRCPKRRRLSLSLMVVLRRRVRPAALGVEVAGGGGDQNDLEAVLFRLALNPGARVQGGAGGLRPDVDAGVAGRRRRIRRRAGAHRRVAVAGEPDMGAVDGGRSWHGERVPVGVVLGGGGRLRIEGPSAGDRLAALKRRQRRTPGVARRAGDALRALRARGTGWALWPRGTASSAEVRPGNLRQVARLDRPVLDLLAGDQRRGDGAATHGDDQGDDTDCEW